MKWDHTSRQNSLPVGRFTKRGCDFVQSSLLTKVMGLLPEVITHDISVTKESVMIRSLRMN